MDKKAWIIFSVVVVALLGGLVFVSGKNKLDVSSVNTNVVQPATNTSGNIADHVFGTKASKVALVEYGDFQCPGCFGAHPNVKAISEKYRNQIAFIFRNFPLTSIHPNALAAASAVEAAGLQGKYWEMNNSLYDNRDNWEKSTAEERTGLFANYAKELGLDVQKFTADIASEAVSKKISYDIALGKKQGVGGTPSFFLNGEELSDNIVNDTIQGSGEQLEAAVKTALQKHGVALPTDKK